MQIWIVFGMPADGQYNNGINRGQYRHNPNEGKKFKPESLTMESFGIAQGNTFSLFKIPKNLI